MKKAKGLRAKIKILFARPDSMDPSLRTILEKVFLRKKVFMQPTRAHRVYIILQTATSLVLLFATILFFDHLSIITTTALAIYILLSLVNTGAIMEQRSWIFYLEFLKILVPLLWIWIEYPHILISVCLLPIIILLMYYFRPMEKRYKRVLYQQTAPKI